MTAKTGVYKVQKINTTFFVVFEFNNGEQMIMGRKSFKTQRGASKLMTSIKLQAGVKEIKERHQENINRLQVTIAKNCWNKNYVLNCENQIANLKLQIS